MIGVIANLMVLGAIAIGLALLFSLTVAPRRSIELMHPKE